MPVRSFAVPLGLDSTKADSVFSVQVDGTWCATEQAVTGYHADGSTAWLWVDVDLPASYEGAYVYPTASPMVTAAQLDVTGTVVTVDTGVMFDVADLVPYVTDDSDVRHDGACSWSVVEQTGLRVVMRADVTYGDPELCAAILWVYFTRGSTVLHVEHRWVCSQPTLALHEIGLDFPAGGTIEIRDEADHAPADVVGDAAVLWTGGLLDGQPATLIDQGIWSADYLAAVEYETGYTEADVRAQTVSAIRAFARTHWIGFEWTGGAVTWDARTPLRLPPSWWVAQWPIVPPFAVAGENADLDTLSNRMVAEQQGPVEAGITEYVTGWWHQGQGPQLRYTRVNGHTCPTPFRSMRMARYFLNRNLGYQWMRGTTGAWNVWRWRVRPLLDNLIVGAGTYAGGVDDAGSPAGAWWRVTPNVLVWRLCTTENCEGLSQIAMWWQCSHDYGALHALKLCYDGITAYLTARDATLPVDPTPAQVFAHYKITEYKNRWWSMRALIALAEVFNDWTLGDRVLGWWDLMRDVTQPGHMDPDLWPPESYEYVLYKFSEKLLPMLEIAARLDSTTLRDGAVNGAVYLANGGEATAGRLKLAALAMAHRVATDPNDRATLASYLTATVTTWLGHVPWLAGITTGPARWTAYGSYTRDENNAEITPSFDVISFQTATWVALGVARLGVARLG